MLFYSRDVHCSIIYKIHMKREHTLGYKNVYEEMGGRSGGFTSFLRVLPPQPLAYALYLFSFFLSLAKLLSLFRPWIHNLRIFPSRATREHTTAKFSTGTRRNGPRSRDGPFWAIVVFHFVIYLPDWCSRLPIDVFLLLSSFFPLYFLHLFRFPHNLFCSTIEDKI